MRSGDRKARGAAGGMLRRLRDPSSYRLVPGELLAAAILSAHVGMDSRSKARHRTRATKPTAPAQATPPAASDLSPRAFALAVLCILVLTAIVHSREFRNPFLFFDDPQNVLENPPIRALTAHNL